MNRFINKSIYHWLFIVGSLLLPGLLTQCHSSEGKIDEKEEADAKETAETPAKTEVFALKRGQLASSLQVPGELVAFRDVDIYGKVSGFIKALYVDVGSEVKQGQLLALAEAPEISAQLSSAESKLKAQQAISIASAANYERILEASKLSGAVSKNDVDQATARRNSDAAQLEAAKSAYREIADQKKYLEIRAPFNGIISTRNTSTGAYIGPSGKGSEFPLFVLTENDKLRLVISIPEAYTGYVNLNDRVSFSVRTFPNRQFSGPVKRQSGALDKRLRSERVEVDVLNNDRKLLPGMVAEVTIPLPTKSNTFVVPKSAVINSTAGVYVIKVVNGKAVWVPIKKGLEANDKAEIFGELHEGDPLVTTATEEIRDGSLVKTQ